MTEQDKPERQTSASIRTVVEGVAVAAIVWLALSVTQQNVALAKVQTQLMNMQTTLTGVPAMQQSVTTMSVVQAEHERRLEKLEQEKLK